MKSIASYLITFFVVIFWIFRIAVALTASLDMDFGIKPMNLTIEIVLLFVTLLAIVLIIKRNIIGALIYFSAYLLYFGSSAFSQIGYLSDGTMGINSAADLIISFVAIILSIMTLFDVLSDKVRTGSSSGRNKKTDWFYKNEQFDRKLDERADKNNYRTL
ncbi:MAG: hypothetical protein IKP28_05670 [Clostridia bacterium]|nr:hypothetical protein [Clostridia bacterium]